jgi:colanic acid/amylovoran biosynthesis glycosyltransferase
VKTQSLSSIARSHLRTLFSRPATFFKGLACALRQGKGHARSTLSWLFYFVEAIVVGEWMRANQLPHVHIHYSSNVGLLLSKVFPITISCTFHGPDEFKDPTGFVLTEKIVASRFACAVSDFGRSQMMLASDYSQWSKLEVTRLGVDTNRFRPREQRDHPERFELLTAGRLAPVKAQHVLLAAMEMLSRPGRQIRLRIAGDGPDRASLEEHVRVSGLADCVEFLGFVNQDEMSQLYQETDAFLLPSFAEGVPVVLMEAMAMGIPCVATCVNGIPELIRHELDGLTVVPGNAAELARATMRLINDPVLRRDFSRRARQRAVEIADLGTNVAHLADVFARHLGHGRARPQKPAIAEVAARY